MKTIYIFLLGMFLGFNATAQVWVKPNAVWHYDIETNGFRGFQKIQHVGDTVIDSKNAMIFQATNYLFARDQYNNYFLSSTQIADRNYTHVSGDTVFYWKDNQFEILYNFSSNVGESWNIRYGSDDVMCSDSSSVTVSGDEMVNIEGVNLRSITLHADSSSLYNLEGNFNERFGAYSSSHLRFNLPFPARRICDPMMEQLLDYYYFSFKCFQDDEMYYNPSGIDCEYLLNHVGVYSLNGVLMEIYPNPIHSNGTININSTGNYTIIDLKGKVHQTGKIENNKIQLNSYESGMYILKLENNGTIHQQKITVL